MSNEPDLFNIYGRFKETHSIRSADFSVSGRIQRWSWLDAGSGDRTILLLPGFLGRADTCFPYILALEPHFRILSFTYPPSTGSVDALCDGMITVMDELHISRVNVLGGSYSGYLAQVLVRRNPDRMNSLILTHTGLPDNKHARTAVICLFLAYLMPFQLFRRAMLLSRYLYFPRTTDSSSFWRGHFEQVISQQSRESMLNRFRLMCDFHQNYHFDIKDLAGWPGQMLIMEMGRDDMTTPADQAAMRGLYPQAEVRVFPYTEHMDSVDQPEQQISVIKGFFVRCS